MKSEKLILNSARFARGSIEPPGSKSIANRILPVSAMGRGNITITNIPGGEDVLFMIKALKKLGISIQSRGSTLKLKGLGGPIKVTGKCRLKLGNSGTATRFLTAILTAGMGKFEISGIARLHQRPIGDLVEALSPLLNGNDSRIEYLGAKKFPPVLIDTMGLNGGTTSIKGNTSSQFLSGLLMAIPLSAGKVRVRVTGKLVSGPYVDITLGILKKFGCHIIRGKKNSFKLPAPAGYINPKRVFIESDATSASYFLAAGAIGKGPVTVKGVGSQTLQFKSEGGFAKVLAKMGARVIIRKNSITVRRSENSELKGIDIDMDTMSDSGMTLAVTACFARGSTTIRNIGNWRVKETDRIKAMAAELRKTGADIKEKKDSLTITPPERWRKCRIKTYNDHRMAMSFSLLCFSGFPVEIMNPACVNKTYPGFFKDLLKILKK